LRKWSRSSTKDFFSYSLSKSLWNQKRNGPRLSQKTSAYMLH
jgi:hypothetical protein